MMAEHRIFRLPVTRFSRIRPTKALALLACTAIAIAACAFHIRRTSDLPKPGRGSDLPVLHRIIDRVRAGEGYYDAAGAELRASGYGTRSIFNWRTPLYAWLMGSVPSLAWARAIIGSIAVVAMALAFRMLAEEGSPWLAAANSSILFGALAGCFVSEALVTTEVWAGTLIVLSISAYARDHPRLGLTAGLFALFLRELVLPYAIVSVFFAFRERRRGDLVLWAAGLGLYAAYYGVHATRVHHHISAIDHGDPTHWIRLGGIPFILSTASMNIWIRVLPKYALAAYLPLSLLGLAGRPGRRSRRAVVTVAAYLAFFALVGKPFNGYWGLLYSPLLTFGICWSPSALSDLIKSCRGMPAGSPMPPSMMARAPGPWGGA